MPLSSEYRELLVRVKEIGTLEQIAGLLSWDEQTYMPPGSFKGRATHNAIIAGIIHERLTSPGMKKLIRELKKQELSPDGKIILREIEWKYDRASKIPEELVTEISRTSSMAIDAGRRARKNSQFKEMEPWLKKMIELKKKTAEHIGYEKTPYDALLDEFEPGIRSGDIDIIFSRLTAKLTPVIAKILEQPEPRNVIPAGKYPIEEQAGFITEICRGIGYNMEYGRIDIAAHPFTSGSGKDVRITVKYDESNPAYAVFPAIHETGHALYDQGFLEKYYCTPLAEPVSHGIHESQSRLWENIVARSIPFWTYHYPKMQSAFPRMKKVPFEDFYRNINRVKSSYIRVDADEVTYNMHIILRYEVESEIFGGRLKTDEIPAFWNDHFERYLGIEVPDDASGCLQDIHWAAGAFGYFPSYALGNLYAAQLWNTAKNKIPDLEKGISKGDHSALLEWLRKNVHRHGKRYGSNELIKKITGKNIDENYFIDYVKEKYGNIYGIML